MGNKLVIFPAGKEVQARAYAAWTDNNCSTWPGICPWSYVRNDVFGQWVVPYLGPPQAYDTIEIAEPAGGEAMRADGVLHDFAVWPDV